QIGMGLADMTKTKLFPVVVRTEIDYRRPAALGDKLVVKGWLDKFERTRFWVAFQITRPSDGTLIAECRQTMALVQMPEGKPVRLPKDWDTLFAHLKG
ncbi:MAG TPA: thioesterase family protein, partial [Chthoniobacteraceae bacterium]|nr:thioesterase family protein [Chthoniobacteraceae bacterium]